jgi:hypothetical protein
VWPACRGVLLRGATASAVTYADGVNGRDLPGRTSNAVVRYAGNCTLGFDGYCLADPRPDYAFPTTWTDPRWYRINRNRGWRHGVAVALANHERGTDIFVSGSVLRLQAGLESATVKRLDPQECGRVAQPAPSTASMRLANGSDGTITLTLNSPAASNYGFAVWLGTANKWQRYRQVGAGLHHSAIWDYARSARFIHGKESKVAILGTACIATNVPADKRAGSARLYLLDKKGKFIRLQRAVPKALDMEVLRKTACLSER